MTSPGSLDQDPSRSRGVPPLSPSYGISSSPRPPNAVRNQLLNPTPMVRSPTQASDPPGLQGIVSPTQQPHFFPRSVTIGEGRTLPPLPRGRPALGGNSRVVSYHPDGTSQADGYDSGPGISDIDRIPSTAGSSDINLQGRSYRFHTNTDHHGPGQLVSSYTATSGTIRDNTALLADMLLKSDDEDSTTNSSRIEEQTDEGGNVVTSVPIQAQKKNEETYSFLPASVSKSQSKGPSNLSKAINASRSTSPSTVKVQQDPDKEIIDLEAGEDTPLLGPGRRRMLSPSKSRDSSQESSLPSRSDSRALRGEMSGNGSGFSVLSGSGPGDSIGNSGDRTGVSFSFGYGALVQASQQDDSKVSRAQSTSGQTSGARRVSFAQSDRLVGYSDDAETGESVHLSLPWKLVPPTLRPGRGTIPVRPGPLLDISYSLSVAYQSLRKLTWRDVLSASTEPVRLLPAVILGMLLNILDGVSYGLIIFPTSYPIFSDFGGDGVSMFFVTCIISQLVYTLGGSIFRGGNGSMMIEVVPFYHILVTIIIDKLGDQDPTAVVSTTIVSFAMSSIFAGLVFLLLGYFRLGVLVGFFPRHILVGCIGGVGVFLIETGLEVSAQLKSESGFQWNFETLRFFVQSWSMVAHWLPPLLLAILLRFITSKFHQPLIFPAYFLAIPAVFFAVTLGILKVPLDDLRRDDWVFDVGKAAEAPFWRFYTYFDFRKTSWQALWATMPTQLALTFFSILHVPLNVPALAISVNEDNLDTDRELVAHGVSNILAGLAGSVPNYLCYVNSVLFYRVGGGSRLSGMMLAAGTFAILLAGPGAIGYLPIYVVGALIFVLGLDLTKEAVWDTIGRVNGWEYFTIWLIIFVMTYYDFVVGILAGIIVACLFFVIQTSRRRTVRAVLDGSIARSTVRRHLTQRRFLERVGSQTQIVKLQGFLYFANISSVEELIRRALDIATWQARPIRFLLVDFSLVNGVDFSAAEAFTRIQRLLQAKDVVLIFCGLTPESDVGVALRSVDLWADCSARVEVFQNLNEALEWSENEYLRGMYASITAAKSPVQPSTVGGDGMGGAGPALDVPDRGAKRAPAFNLEESMENSPRRHHLREAAKEATERSRRVAELMRSVAEEQDGEASNADEQSARSGTDDEASVVDSARTSDGEAAALASAQLQQGRRQSLAQNRNIAAAQPLPLLMITFQGYSGPQHNENFFRMIAPMFERIQLQRGDVLWERGAEPDALYLIESGILKARYDFPQEDYEINEAMLAGTIAGELSFLSSQTRNTEAFADLDCVLWKLDRQGLGKLQEKQDIFKEFMQMLLKACTEEQEGLMSYLVSRLS